MGVTVEVGSDAFVLFLYALQTLILLATYLVIRSRLTVVASIVVELGKRFTGTSGSLNWKSIVAQAAAPMLPQLINSLLGGRGKPPGAPP